MAKRISAINTERGSDPLSELATTVEDLKKEILVTVAQLRTTTSTPTGFNATEIQYIPILFKVLYNHDKNGETFPDTEELDVIYANINEMIDNANSVLAGESNNSVSSHVDGYWLTTLSSLVNGVSSPVRLFLPYKIPKEYLYPFYPATIYSNNSNDADVSSLGAFKSSFGFGVKSIDESDTLTYESSYTYENVRDKRKVVKDLYNSFVASADNSATADEVESAKTELAAMEEDYFFFFGDRPGVIFIRRFDDDAGFISASASENLGAHQMNAIRSNDWGEIPTNNSISGKSSTSMLYELASKDTVFKSVSKGFLSNIPFLSVATTNKEGAWNNLFLGVATRGSAVTNSISLSFNIASIVDVQAGGGGTYLDSTYSVFLHEFFHTLGYNHRRDGVNISGTVSGDALSDFSSRTKASKRISDIDFATFYTPFEPPFKYYDPENNAQDLNDLNTLPDFGVIDPDEKTYVETVINHFLPDATNNFTDSEITSNPSGSNGFVFGGSGSSMVNVNNVTKQAELFGLISHLPTFWGGSYTTNEDGSKSMLINASSLETASRVSSEVSERVRSIAPAVGDFYGGGVVGHITDSKIYIVGINSTVSGKWGDNDGHKYVDLPNDIDSGINNTAQIIAESLGTNYVAHKCSNLAEGGQDDWYMPSLDLLSAVFSNFRDINLSPNNIGWLDITPFAEMAEAGSISIASSSTEGLYQRKLAMIKFDGTLITQVWIPFGSNKHTLPVREEIISLEEIPTVEIPTVEIPLPTEGTDSPTPSPPPINRVGPSITVYNPVCDKNDNTKINWGFVTSMDWYNPAYPPFPPNTKVEDMFSPDLCPCLYQEQTFQWKNKFNELGTKSLTLFNKKVDEATSSEINTTTGIPNLSDNSVLITEALTSNAQILKYWGGDSLRFGNTSTNLRDYYGYKSQDAGAVINPIVWLKEVNGITIPNFPVYIGYMPEGLIPSVIKYNPELVGELNLGKFDDVTIFNDSTIYREWGYDFNTIINKYLRVGSTNSSDDDYNPFLIDGNAVGFPLHFTDYGESYSAWSLFDTRIGATSIIDTPLTDWFKRTLPNTSAPSIDNIGDTLFGPLNQNVNGNIMYYESRYIDPVLPSSDMLNRLSYLATEAPTGILHLARTIVEDLFDVEGENINIFPDTDQQTTSQNQVQQYINTAIDSLYDLGVAEDEIVYGCVDDTMFNYNPNATVNDGSCIERIFGCMNPTAHNYNSIANTDNGECDHYSLVPSEIELIPVCPAEFTAACNPDGGEHTVVNINDTISDAGDPFISIAPKNDEIIIKTMINDPEHSYWSQAGKITILDKYRYSGGDCTNLLGSDIIGTLNQGGGCINIPDPSICIFPTVHNYQCDLIGNLTATDRGFTSEVLEGHQDYTMLVQADETGETTNIGFMPFAEFVTYFDGISSGDNNIGTCN